MELTKLVISYLNTKIVYTPKNGIVRENNTGGTIKTIGVELDNGDIKVAATFKKDQDMSNTFAVFKSFMPKEVWQAFKSM